MSTTCQLRPLTFLPTSNPPEPAPTVPAPLPDCASTIPALGVGSRPALSRSRLRSASYNRSVVPSARHCFEIPEQRLPRRIVVRQLPPQTAGAHHVEDRVNDRSTRMLFGLATKTHRRHKWLDHRPLRIAQVMRIALTRPNPIKINSSGVALNVHTMTVA